ncbi:MAG: hypothetical protein Q9219_001582 [cf. Caloplaca sp. 3 TL-2023]
MWQAVSQQFINPDSILTIANEAYQVEEILAQADLVPRMPSFMHYDLEYGDRFHNENRPGRLLRTSTKLRTSAHPSSSVNSKLNLLERAKGTRPKPVEPALYAYSHLVHRSILPTLLLRDTTACTPLMAALFGGKLTFDSEKETLLLDGWLQLEMDSITKTQSLTLVLELQRAFDRLLATAYADFGRGGVSVVRDPATIAF